jgi:hypothetical protein
LLATLSIFTQKVRIQITQGLKLRKYNRGQVGPYQINFGSPYNLLGAHQVRLPPRLQGALWQRVRAPGSPGINGVKSCILAIFWHQNWPFRNYNLIQKIKNFQNIFLKINLFYMHQYTMTSEIYSWNQISGRFKAWHMVSGRVVGHQCRNLRFFFLTGDWRLMHPRAVHFNGQSSHIKNDHIKYEN